MHSSYGCYDLEHISQRFRKISEAAVNRLHESTHQQLHTMKELESRHQQIRNLTEESLQVSTTVVVVVVVVIFNGL